jgi:AbrB family looped-hinge helix DNA binding protein
MSEGRIGGSTLHVLAAAEPVNQGKILDAIRDDMNTADMTRVTGKFQITLPKRLVDAFGIRVGDEVELVAAGDAIRIVPAGAVRSGLLTEQQLRLFDEATQRMKKRAKERKLPSATDRGWTRDELYHRGRAR